MLNVALIGFGGIAQAHKNGYATMEKLGKARLVAVCDIRKEAFEKTVEINLKTENKNTDIAFQCYTDLEEMLRNEKIDLIDICVPSYLHREISVKMLERGYNVLCEKPMALNSEDCTAMLEAEKKSRAQLGVCQQNRFEPNMIWLMDFIKEHGFKSGVGLVSWKRDEAYYRSGAWRGTILEEGGGVMINQALHTLDLLMHICGMPTHATAHISNDFHKDYIEVEDTAVAHFEMEDGTRYHFYATNNATADLPVQLQFVTKDNKKVFATNDIITVDDELVTVAEKESLAGHMVGKAVWGTGHAVLINDFYRCIEENVPFRIPGVEGAKVIQLILSMYNSHGNRIKTMA